MGTPIPEEPFVIDPAKTYKVTTDSWGPVNPSQGCGGPYFDKLTCTRTGQRIIDWLDAGSECTHTRLCAPELSFLSERIISIEEV